MFDIGWSELLLVAILAIVFVGPKDLPRLMRTIGVYVGKARRMMAEFQQAFEDLARDSELDDLRREISELKRQTQAPLTNIRNTIEKPAAAKPASAEPSLQPVPSPEEIERLEDGTPAVSVQLQPTQTPDALLAPDAPLAVEPQARPGAGERS